ncbi:unnamed protein product [Callosobruchus maculatus]|uniref:Lipocalin/cytosolic fatty-acid binding domain-containing protein n=1 Tax=Callosobruchus maculatus TaxID=64391 RepID=A0A653DM28_CALMS|nr:unnamed protein product [Callosobruchus maculatus]
MMITFLTLCGCLLVVGASDCKQCPILSAAGTVNDEFSLLGDNILYVHHRFGPEMVAEKCWSTSFFVSDYNLLDDSLHLNWTYYEQDPCNRSEIVKVAAIGNEAKYYGAFHGKALIHTEIAMTREYVVNYICNGDDYAVEILTTNKKRDERVIKDAIKAAKKVIDLPSPSVNLECDKLIKEE